MPTVGLGMVVLLMGCLAGALAVVGIDLLVVLIALRFAAVRERLGRRGMDKARQRAVDRLGPAAQYEWHALDSLVRRVEPFNAQRYEVDGLLTTFLNVALAQAHARRCYEPALDDPLPVAEGPGDGLRARRRAAGLRSERAMEELGRQLECTAELIRLECELAVAGECETAAELWVGEVRDACTLPRLLSADDE